MALTETYVDPSIAADSGTGTIGDPYGDLQYDLNTMTRDAVNGDRINIKTGTDEILAAPLTLATYGVPTRTAPLVFQGYTSAADDGGIGGIDGNGNASIYSDSGQDNVSWINLSLFNVTGVMIRSDRESAFINCTFFNGGTGNQIWFSEFNVVDGCSFTDSSTFAVNGGGRCQVRNCTFRNGSPAFFGAVRLGAGSVVENNVMILSATTDGITFNEQSCIAIGNSIFSVNGTGQAINGTGDIQYIINNIIEGFSGIGGVGVDSSGYLMGYAHNKFFNNTSNEGSLSIINNRGNNDTLAASAFLDAANNDFRVNISVKALAYPTANFPNLSVRTFLDVGALQREEGAVVVVPPVGVSLGQLYNVPAEDRIYEVLS